MAGKWVDRSRADALFRCVAAAAPVVVPDVASAQRSHPTAAAFVHVGGGAARVAESASPTAALLLATPTPASPTATLLLGTPSPGRAHR
jgi:hypothetical protein